MKVADLLETRRENWRELETLCDKLANRRLRTQTAPLVARFASLYRAACADLALSDAYQLPPNTAQYLHHLVGRRTISCTAVVGSISPIGVAKCYTAFRSGFCATVPCGWPSASSGVAFWPRRFAYVSPEFTEAAIGARHDPTNGGDVLQVARGATPTRPV